MKPDAEDVAAAFDAASLRMRVQLTAELQEFKELLRPYVDGSFGEVLPGHGQLWLKAQHEIGLLWNAHKPPHRPESKGVPVAKVQQLLSEQRERLEGEFEVAVAAAVAAAQEAVRAELQQRERVSLERGRQQVLEQLQATRLRLGS